MNNWQDCYLTGVHLRSHKANLYDCVCLFVHGYGHLSSLILSVDEEDALFNLGLIHFFDD
jgi:hypothetical protein